EDHPLVAVDQQARRLRITSSERLDQRGVIHRHLALPAGRPAGRLPPAGRLSTIIPQPRQSGFTIRSGRTETDAKRHRIAIARNRQPRAAAPPSGWSASIETMPGTPLIAKAPARARSGFLSRRYLTG